MNIVTWFRVVLVLVLALTIVVVVQTVRASRADLRAVRLAADLQEQSLLAAGWARTAEATAAEMDELVPSLRGELEEARRVNADLLAAQHATGSVRLRPRPSNAVEGDRADAPPVGPAAPGPDDTAHPSPTSPVPCADRDVEVDADLQEAIAGLADGRIVWSRRLKLRADGGEWEDVPLTGVPSVDPRLARAWAASLRRERPRAWVAVRAGVRLDDGSRDWEAGLAAGRGLWGGYVTATRGAVSLGAEVRF